VVFAVNDQTSDLPGMVFCIPGGTPHTGYAELATSAIFIVIGTINPAPGMGTTDFYPPAMFFSIP